MSGICALFRFDGGPVARDPLAQVLDALHGWGGTATDWVPESDASPVALGCRLQPVTPEDAFDRQPVVAADGTCALVADARIDNRSELARSLGIEDAAAAAMPDSAFILAAWNAWGEDCVRHLLGDYAFLLWDGRRRALFGARDAIGQRVLFYHVTPRWLSVASAPAALLRLGHVPARLNEQKVADTLLLMQDAETTFFEGVQRLPAGHTLVATASGLRLRRFWEPVPAREIVLSSDAEYLEAFHEVFGAAVDARLRSASPVGIMLSAGLDSATVAAVAATRLAARGGQLFAFHSAPRPGFEGEVRPGWIADESSHVRAIAQLHPNIDLEIQYPGERTPLDDLDTLFRTTGMPVRNTSNRAWVENIYLSARRRGIGVLLSGQKGNATISYTGLRSLRDLARSGRWAHVLREVRAVARATGQPARRVLKYQILPAVVPGSFYRVWSRIRRSPEEPIWAARMSAIRPEFAEALGMEARLRSRRDDDFSLDRQGGLAYRSSILTGGDALDSTHALRAWFGIETRDPTSDRRVVEFCLGIPGSQYLRNGRGRLLIRRSMRGLLPEAVLERETRGAQASDWSEWLPAMRPALARELERLERSETAQRCLDLPGLRSLVEHWPARLGMEHMADYNHRLLRGVMMGRFITWFEEAYG